MDRLWSFFNANYIFVWWLKKYFQILIKFTDNKTKSWSIELPCGVFKENHKNHRQDVARRGASPNSQWPKLTFFNSTLLQKRNASAMLVIAKSCHRLWEKVYFWHNFSLLGQEYILEIIFEWSNKHNEQTKYILVTKTHVDLKIK